MADPPDGIAIDAVIVAGDIYDRAVPPVEAVALLERTLAELAEHTTVIISSGNHDSAIRLGFGARLFTDRIRLRTELADIGTPVLLVRRQRRWRSIRCPTWTRTRPGSR